MSGCPSCFSLRELLLILQVPGQMLPPHWSPPWSPSWSEEHPICLSQCSAHTAVGTLLQGMSEIFWLVGLLHKTSWAQGSLFSVFPRPDSGPDMCSVNVGWMDESSSPKGSVFIHSFKYLLNTYYYQAYKAQYRHRKYSSEQSRQKCLFSWASWRMLKSILHRPDSQMFNK